MEVNGERAAKNGSVLNSVPQPDSKFRSSTQKKRGIALPYTPPHRRNQTTANNVTYDLRRPKCNGKSTEFLLKDISTIEKNTKINKLSNGDIISRILKLADVHINVGFKAIVNEIYFEKYGESLPIELLETLKFCVIVDTNTTKNAEPAKLISDDKKNADKNNHSTPYQNGPLTKISEPGVLNLEDYVNNEYWINIYNCITVSEIWGVIIDAEHLDKLQDLADHMMLFYEFENPAKSVVEGSFYAVFDGSWHRVKCIKNDGLNAKVFFIDRGDEDSFLLAKLHVLDQRFCMLPAQAIKMCIPNLKIFSRIDEMQEILKELISDTIVFTKIINLDQEKHSLSVELYVKRDEEIVNINDLIVDQLFETVLNPKSYIQLDKTMQVHISHVNEKGIFIQIPSKSLQYFKLLMKESKNNDENLKRQTVIRFNDDNKIYLVKNNRNDEWYRAKIVKFKNDKEIEVLLIDVGSTVDVNREDFILLEKLCSILAKYPAQAILVQLDQFTEILHSRILDRLQSLTSDTDHFYVKFISSGTNNNIPIVQLFKKTQNNFLASINDALLLSQKTNTKNNIHPEDKSPSENTDFDSNVDIVFLHALRESLKKGKTENVKSFPENNYKMLRLNSLLNPSDVPEDDYFDVHIALIKDPSHFVIQLLRCKSVEFTQMVADMSETCNLYKGPKLTHESVQVGQLYGCKYDQQWYRAYVIKIKDKNTVMVFLCDYGNYSEIDIENLVPLQYRFYKLPYQAIYAELHGVKPISGKWTVKDCLRFKDLTYSKHFVAIVKNKTNIKTKYNDNLPVTVETVYGLELIDTTTDEDICIADILIKEKRALRT